MRFYYPLHGHLKQSFSIIHRINAIKLNNVVKANAVNNPSKIAIAIDAVAIVIVSVLW